MKSRKWIGTVLITLVVVAVLAAGGYGLYRYGYMRGAIAANAGEGFMFHDFGRMPFPGGYMGEGFMFHDDEDIEGYRGEGFMFHEFEDMPFQGGRMGDLPHRFPGRSDLPFQRFDTRVQTYGHMLPSRTFYSPFSLVVRVLFLGLIVWVFYKIIKLFTGGRNWQLTFNSQVEPEPEVEAKPKGRATKK
jgi:hypothetical protein